MKSFRTLLRLCPILVATLMVWAGEPWKEKPYAEWTEKEVKKILAESPWARSVTQAVGANPQSSGPPRQGVQKRVVTVYDSSGRPIGGVYEQRDSGPSFGGEKARQPYVARWDSSVTIREAQARRQQLAGTSHGAGETESAGRQLAYYIVGLVPRDKRTAEKVRPLWGTIMPAPAYLEPQQSHRAIQSVRAHFVKHGDEVLLHFYFPRAVDGNPVIGPGEQKVRFSWGPVSTDFDLRKMVRDGKPDL